MKPFLALAGAFVLLASCSYKEAAVFPFASDGDVAIYGLSKNAAQGFLALSGDGKLEYVFDGPLKIPDDASIEIDYSFSPSQSDDATPGQIVLSLGENSWELPWSFSFLGFAESPDELRYVIPVPPLSLDRLSIAFIPAEKSENKNAPRLRIHAMALARRWFGYSREDALAPVAASPFVYMKNASLYIDPPQAFRIKGKAELLIDGPGEFPGGLKIEGGNEGPGYFRMEASNPAVKFTVPDVFIGSGSFPLMIDSITAGSDIKSVKLLPAPQRPFPEPIPADPGLILAWPKEAFRDPRLEVFRWEGFPQVLIFDMADYDVQDRFLKRLAFFVEKAGFRGRLAKDEEIANLHGWNAHDYRASALAGFFEAARKTDFPLLKEEKELESILLAAGILRKSSNGAIEEGEGAIVSVSQESKGYLRTLFMVHESFHGLYFIDSDFRNYSRQRWEALPQVPKRFILSYFGYQAYDTRDTDLVINEFMAHILQQPVSQAAKYFGESLAGRINESEWRRSVLPAKDEASGTWPELAEAFTQEAQAFSSYVNRRFGLAAGRVRKVSIRFD
ncbi:hypothetical protein [Leadbettera azotonutricia]|uniref:Putative lipoprotein n=1 Tax=Leadbettera azotonutricia (strain ATCC BAA-888 / DSM 13862 / ZAS-9) TaxID=545695 RepID=F5Y877_LEAAZ|nr:hypothetical protein [Leadbettera azotonutricia]AEF80146.1 putative lipoprotein [Leadbettera azotonutricia ZAS-9]